MWSLFTNNTKRIQSIIKPNPTITNPLITPWVQKSPGPVTPKAQHPNPYHQLIKYAPSHFSQSTKPCLFFPNPLFTHQIKPPLHATPSICHHTPSPIPSPPPRCSHEIPNPSRVSHLHIINPHFLLIPRLKLKGGAQGGIEGCDDNKKKHKKELKENPSL